MPEDNCAFKIGNGKNVLPLEHIFAKSYDSILVTDKDGNVLMANPAASRLLDIPMSEIVETNVQTLVQRGVYNRSMALEAAETRSMITGVIRTRAGLNLMSTSTPLLDEDGNVTIVITNSRDKDLVDQFIASLDMERAKADRYKNEVAYLRDQTLEKDQIIGGSVMMQELILQFSMIAKVDSTVMLLGESGTGKEVFAKYIHRKSYRCNEPFIAINCAAIPETLMESELFGYDKGAFSGANIQGKAGLLEIADKGTLFLDEIAELPLQLQSKLLRVLETSEVRRLGGITQKKINIRVIAATNRNLKRLVRENKFREDLYYRLNVVPITIPPLRERPGDILELAHAFLNDLNKKYGYNKAFSATILDGLTCYQWPGNIRELRNVVERLFITTVGDVITQEDEYSPTNSILPIAIVPHESRIPFGGTLRDALQITEKQYIRQVLADCDGRICAAADRLGIHRTVLWRKLKEQEKSSDR